MKETILQILQTPYFWIAMELILVAVLAFLIKKNSRRKKTIREDMEHRLRADKYRELDEMLDNPRRDGR